MRRFRVRVLQQKEEEEATTTEKKGVRVVVVVPSLVSRCFVHRDIDVWCRTSDVRDIKVNGNF